MHRTHAGQAGSRAPRRRSSTRGNQNAALRGYVADAPYVTTYQQQLAPAWLDHVALLRGFAPPDRRKGFAWCELGCGRGVTAVVLAATHPQGRFVGIDAAPAHIEHARRLAAEAGAANAAFRAVDFAQARELDLPMFDYIVAHGVFSWIDAFGQGDLLAFVRDRLAPGGLVYLSYNALPGWTADLALREIVRSGAKSAKGDSAARAKAGMAFAGDLMAAGALSLAQSRFRDFRSQSAHYLAHEFLAADAQPLFVTDLRAAAATAGLVPVGSAHLVENYDRFVLRAAEREFVARVENADLRELARDCLLNTGFRSDIFTRDAQKIANPERERRLLASPFLLTQPAAAVRFSTETPAGALRFDNDEARRLVATLSRRPRPLAQLTSGARSQQDCLANALTLAAAGVLWPAEPLGRPPVRLLEAILRRLDGPEEILLYPLACGAALSAPRGLLQRLRDKRPLDDYPGWRAHLDALSGGPAQRRTSAGAPN